MNINAHPLETKYGLSAFELMDAINRRLRLKVALEGAVAEVHFERKIEIAVREGWLGSYESHDLDGMHDFSLVTLAGRTVRVEVKTCRNMTALKVELQKTRNAQGDPRNRLYDASQFDVVAVNIGRHTGDWAEFRYALTSNLSVHRVHTDKLAVMHSLDSQVDGERVWRSKLQEILDELG